MNFSRLVESINFSGEIYLPATRNEVSKFSATVEIHQTIAGCRELDDAIKNSFSGNINRFRWQDFGIPMNGFCMISNVKLCSPSREFSNTTTIELRMHPNQSDPKPALTDGDVVDVESAEEKKAIEEPR